MNIQFTQRVELNKPVLFAAWPGMGNVALGAINYLRKKLVLEQFALFDTTNFFAPDGVEVNDGIAQLPASPKSIFYFRKEPDIVVMENQIQLGGKSGVDFGHEIADFAYELGVMRIFTGAAFPMPTSYKETVRLFGVTNTKSGLDLLNRYQVKPMEDGSISGLNGLLLGYAKEKGIESICVLATMPIYATGFPNPRAGRALVELFTRVLEVKIDFTELDLMIEKSDARMEQIETHLEEMLGIKEKVGERTGDEPVSQTVLNKIERLFQEARTNRDKALELKRELDHWGLFQMYEDRFLDLFKKD